MGLAVESRGDLRMGLGHRRAPREGRHRRVLPRMYGGANPLSELKDNGLASLRPAEGTMA